MPIQPIQKVKAWWQGPYVGSTLEHALGESAEGAGHFERPLLAKIMLSIRAFLAKEWKWVITVILSIVALYFAYMKL